MSQKTNLIIEEKTTTATQFNIVEESAKFIASFSLIGFIGIAFMVAMGKYDFALMCLFSAISGVGIYFKVGRIAKEKEQAQSIIEKNRNF